MQGINGRKTLKTGQKTSGVNFRNVKVSHSQQIDTCATVDPQPVRCLETGVKSRWHDKVTTFLQGQAVEDAATVAELRDGDSL